MKRSLIFLFAAALLVTSNSHAQDLKRVRAVLDTLCAPGMHGRGYMAYGDQIAANYLQHQFQSIGLEPATPNTWLQYFTLPVNRFPDRVALQVGSRLLEPGADFLAGAESPAGEGKAKIVAVDTLALRSKKGREKFLAARLSNKALLFSDPAVLKSISDPEIRAKMKTAKLWISLEPAKLTATVLGRQEGPVQFKVLSGSWPAKTRKVKFAVDAELIPNYISQNVLGVVKGSAQPDSFVVFTAHYDHLGRMGRDTYFPGANDNASGTAMLLELARYFTDPAHRPRYSVLFIAFGGEEAGLVGSKFYTDHPMLPLENIRFLLNLDLLGTGDEGITVVNGSVLPGEFKQLEKLNAEQQLLPMIKPRGAAANSDHYPFTSKGIPGFFIYTMGGTNAYHDVQDRPEQLPLTRFREVFQLLTSFSGWLMKAQR